MMFPMEILDQTLWKFKERGDTVYVTHNGKVYTIDKENLTCSCDDYGYRGYQNPGYKCKHIRYYEELKGGKK